MMSKDRNVRIVQTLQTLDSYLSLHAHRGWSRDQWDADDRRQVDAAIAEARKLQKELQMPP